MICSRLENFTHSLYKDGRTSNVCLTAFVLFLSNESLSQCHRDAGNLATYHTKSLQTEQKVGWLKKMAVNSWHRTTWTLGCLKAPLLRFSVVTPSSGITFTDSLLGTAGRKVSHVHRSRPKSHRLLRLCTTNCTHSFILEELRLRFKFALAFWHE